MLAQGLPVLSLPLAKAHASRVSASVLIGLGRTELIARNTDDYYRAISNL